MEDLDAASIEDVSAFFRTYYAPNNAVLTVVGDVDPDEIRRWTERYFGGIPANPSIPALGDLSLPPILGEERRETVHDKVPLPRVYVGFRAPAFGDERLDALDIAGPDPGRRQGLAAPSPARPRRADRPGRRARAARLRRRRVDLRRLGDRPAGRPGRAGRGRPPRGAGAARPREPISDDELARARALIETEELGGLSRVEERADRLSMYATLFDDPDLINQMLPRYLAVTAEQIRDVAARRLPGRQPGRPDLPARSCRRPTRPPRPTRPSRTTPTSRRRRAADDEEVAA